MAKQPGLDGRTRDEDGQTRAKNGNTRIDTLRETYGDDFAEGLRGDAHLARSWNEQAAARSLSTCAVEINRGDSPKHEAAAGRHITRPPRTSLADRAAVPRSSGCGRRMVREERLQWPGLRRPASRICGLRRSIHSTVMFVAMFISDQVHLR